ncbi:MAG: FtsX-like permease family protein [Rubrivivax sp.]
MTRDPPLLRLLPLLWREWRHHPWRHGLVLLAVALGVALAFSVQLINQSALAEFGAAVRAVNGQPDLSLRRDGNVAGVPDELLDRARLQPGVHTASPVLEIETQAANADGERIGLKVLGVDALALAAVAPELLPQPAAGEDRLAALDPGAAFVNAGARQRLNLRDGDALRLQAGGGWQRLRVAGHVAAGGPPLLVMDVAAAQRLFGQPGRLSRIDLRLAPGQDAGALLQALPLPPGVRAAPPGEAEQRLSTLSRAYRVNLTVLALVALFVGGFLVFSVLSLSVAQRTQALALLGVLGLRAAERRQLVLVECALLGAAGSTVGLALGAALAWAALRLLGGDLGGGFFAGVQPALQVDAGTAALCLILGTATALAGGWLPARQAERLAPAQALKGLGGQAARPLPAAVGLGLMALGGVLALLPPVAGLPLAAYASVAALLFGGVALVPAAVQALLAGRGGDERPLWLLARRRARHQRATASAAVAGVVSSLALSVALTVMVASFRDSVAAWLDGVLPADLYARSAAGSAAADQAWFGPELAAAAAALPGVQRVQAGRVRALALQPDRPTVTLLARPLPDPERQLPLQGPVSPAAPGEVGVWVSEAMAALYGARPGTLMQLPLGEGGAPATVRVRGVWRDFARQFGSVVMDHGDYLRVSGGDRRLNELALWLAPGGSVAAVQDGIRRHLAATGDPALLEFAATAELRRTSLHIFDRSFAVTYYLQAVAIAIGLVGIAASLSAQVLARRKEFGLLAHLGLTRRQILAVVAGESAAWLAAGCAIGLGLGLAVSVVLVHVVNPQSFHWSMDLVLPVGRLLALCAAVLATGVATAALAGRQAAARSAVLAVKEDW